MLPTVLKAEQMLKSNRKVFASIQAILRVYYKFLSTTNETISFMPNKYYLDDDSGATPVFKILILTVIFSVSLLLCVVYLWCKNYSNQLILIRLDTDIDRAKKRAEAHTLMLAKYSRDELLISVPSLEGLIWGSYFSFKLPALSFHVAWLPAT